MQLKFRLVVIAIALAVHAPLGAQGTAGGDPSLLASCAITQPAVTPAPVTIQFWNTSSGTITSYAWDFGDGGTSSLQNPQHTYLQAGAYAPMLTVSGPGGSDVFSLPGGITVTPTPPRAAFAVSTSLGVAPLTVQFVDQSAGNLTAWMWLLDGVTTAVHEPLYTFNQPGNFIPVLITTGPDGSATARLDGAIQVLSGQAWHVLGDGTPGGSGTQVDPFGSIQQAIDAASDGDLILVEPGTYAESLHFNGKSVTIEGAGGAPDDVVLDGGGAAATVTVDPWTPSAGAAGTVVVRNVQVTGASGSGVQVGAQATNAAAAVLEDCHVTGNGGAGVSTGWSSVTMKACVIDGNSLGVVTNEGLHLRLIACTVSGNAGDGIQPFCLSTRLSRCVISSNGGSGISCLTGLEVESCVIADNAQNGLGHSPAWPFTCGTVTLVGSTVHGNQVAGVSWSGSGGRVLIVNSIVWGNVSAQLTYGAFAIHPTVLWSDVEGGWPGPGNVAVDPSLADPTSGDHHLLLDSPCAGAGTSAFWHLPPEDLDGDPRVGLRRPDIGADERTCGAEVYGVGEGTMNTLALAWQAGGPAALAQGTIQVSGAAPSSPGYLFLSLAAETQNVYGLRVLIDVSASALQLTLPFLFSASGDVQLPANLLSSAQVGLSLYLQVAELRVGSLYLSNGLQVVLCP